MSQASTVDTATTDGNPPGGDAKDRDARFNLEVSAAVTVLATLLGVFNVKGGNITQAMGQEQSKAVDAWAYFQAKSTKQHVAENTLQVLRLEKLKGNPAEFNAALEQEIAALRAKIETLNKEKEQIKVQAEEHEKNYEALNYRDDQFDMAEAGIDIAIAMLGVSSLTGKRWMAILAGLVGLFGAISGTAGFFALKFHPDLVAQWLG
ncbi:MAG: DUF4337 domain-containing protein [Magnetococcus sp. DMHC-8]